MDALFDPISACAIRIRSQKKCNILESSIYSSFIQCGPMMLFAIFGEEKQDATYISASVALSKLVVKSEGLLTNLYVTTLAQAIKNA